MEGMRVKEGIREIIRVDDMEEKEEDTSEKGEDRPVSREELETKLGNLKGRVPSFVISDLMQNLTGKELTKKKLERIMNRVVSTYFASRGGGRGEARGRGGGEAFSEYVRELNNKLDLLSSEIKELKYKKKESKKKREENYRSAEKSKVPENLEELKSLPPESFLFAAQTGDDKGVRLKSIPEDVLSIMISMKWVEFLIETVGITNFADVLEFYSDLGWISESVLTKLIKYAKGTRPFHEDMDWKPEEKLTARDHMLSLMFIERLRGKKISKDLLILLDRELKKIRSGAEEIYGV
ncbi:archaeal flagella protein [archaeon BMS3Bbin15]|nr:archaeal flagella protein [archaeon BMS3Bbin15]